MALPAASVFEIQTGGNDTNGGGFVAGAAGTDYSQVAGKRVATGTDDSTTDVVGNGTTSITSATANFQASIVGNIIYLQGGTGALAATWRQVVSRTNATTIVLDASVAIGTGITMNVGGALLTIGGCGVVPLVNFNRVWIKAGTYTVTSATINVANGTLSKAALTIKVEGYQTTRGDLGTKPIIIASGITAFTFFIFGGNMSSVTNLELNGIAAASSRGVNLEGYVYRLDLKNFTLNGVTTGAGCTAIGCFATGCTGQPAFSNVACDSCVATACTATPFSAAFTSTGFSRCISYLNTGATTRGFNIAGSNGYARNCVAYANGDDGFLIQTQGIPVINCISEDNVGDGFNIANVPGTLINCAVFSNGVDFALGTNVLATNVNPITGGGTFFTNAAGGDFSLNNTAGAGALLRETAVPTPNLPGGLTANFLDYGAAQHQGGGGGGGGEHSAVF